MGRIVSLWLGIARSRLHRLQASIADLASAQGWASRLLVSFMGPAAVVRVAAGVQSKLVVALTTDFQNDLHSDAATGDVRRGGGSDGLQRIGVLDTSIATRNTGDLIIMEAARSVLDTLL